MQHRVRGQFGAFIADYRAGLSTYRKQAIEFTSDQRSFRASGCIIGARVPLCGRLVFTLRPPSPFTLYRTAKFDAGVAHAQHQATGHARS